MKITDDVRKYAAGQNLAEDDALKAGMEEKSREFAEKGAEVYTSVQRRLSQPQFGQGACLGDFEMTPELLRSPDIENSKKK